MANQALFETRPRPTITIALLGLALVTAVAEPVGAEDGSGSVSGSITVSRAVVRTDGPKHDLDVVLMLQPVAGGELPRSDARVSMDQKGLVFIPHVLAIQKGTAVTFLNSDNDQHNVYFLDDRTGETLDIGTWGPGVSVDHTFEEPGMVITLCKLHLEMAAYIVVSDSPWFVAVELDPSTQAGEFTLADVPPGEYELIAWHKKLKQKGGPEPVSVGSGAASEAEVVLTKASYAKAAD